MCVNKLILSTMLYQIATRIVSVAVDAAKKHHASAVKLVLYFHREGVLASKHIVAG